MDPFKLLSRSSKLQKSTLSGGARLHHIPFTTDFGDLEKHPSNNLDSVQTVARGKKRKRLSKQAHQNNDSPRDFGCSKTLTNITDSKLPHGPIESPSVSIFRPSEMRDVGIGQDTLDPGQCRRILKQHRLRITSLEFGPSNAEKHKEKHELLSKRTKDSVGHGKAHPRLTTQPLQSFNDLGPRYNVSKRVRANLDVQGYKIPTKVQLGSLPLLLGNDRDRGLQLESNKELEDHSARSAVDLLTIAPTGSGKTLAFLIHVLHGLRQDGWKHSAGETSDKEQKSTQALILAPTRELVDQIVNEGKKLAFDTGIKISRMAKGMSLGSNAASDKTSEQATPKDAMDDLADGRASKASIVQADIVVSTPMSLLHAIEASSETTTTSLTQVRYLVLDEADVLLDPLFRVQTLDVWNACTNCSLQTTLWSATIGSSIESLAHSYIMDRRRMLDIDVKQPKHHVLRLVVGLKDSAISNISHQLVYAASEQGKLMALRQMIHPNAATMANKSSMQPPFLIFAQTISRAIALHSELLYDIPVEAGGSSRIAVLHSDLSDTARTAIMAGFRKGEIWILITTDLLARGIDFRGINGVVNYDIPNTSGNYIHRVGRTGRQGREGGVAVTLYTKEDINYAKNVANVIAASEKQRGKSQDTKADDGRQQWLLNALPDVSKKTKKTLKRTGVEARNSRKNSKDGGKEARRMRISTKSGYDRRLEQMRKNVVVGVPSTSERAGSDEDWEGLRD
ncbi:MAG: hypothetical protein Q9182_003616 [Xanthomendoza sp. 2 TL-2023]